MSVNLDGSTSFGYRYTMPPPQVKVEGSGKMIKTWILNFPEICTKIFRPPNALLSYLAQALGAQGKSSSKGSYLSGTHSPSAIQAHIISFVAVFVLCQRCKNPETKVEVKGKKKPKKYLSNCASCGFVTKLDSSSRIVKLLEEI